MPIPASDDFSIFAEHKHMFFDVREPFVYMRERTEEYLRRQKADTTLIAIKAFNTRRFFTIVRERTNEDLMLVVHFGTCFRAKLSVTHDGGSHAEIDSTLTFLFGDMHLHGSQKTLNYFDFGGDAERAFQEEQFERRFMQFRVEECEPSPVIAEPRRKAWWKFW